MLTLWKSRTRIDERVRPGFTKVSESAPRGNTDCIVFLKTHLELSLSNRSLNASKSEYLLATDE